MTLYDSLMAEIAQKLQNLIFDVISAEQKSSVDEDGNVNEYCRYTVEIPKGNGGLSRQRLTVKIPDAKKLKVQPADLEVMDICARFIGLEISFIDVKRNVYFRAEAIEVIMNNLDQTIEI